MQQQLDNLFGALTQGTGPQVTPLAFLMLMAVSLLLVAVHRRTSTCTSTRTARPAARCTARFRCSASRSPPSSSRSSFRCRSRSVCSARCRSSASARRSRSPRRSASSCSSSPRRSRSRRSSCAFVGIIFVVALAALFGQALTRRFMRRGRRRHDRHLVAWRTERPADPAAITALLRKRLSEGQARERFADRPRNRRVLQLSGHLGQRACRTAGRARTRPPARPPTTSSSTDRAHCKCPATAADPLVAAHRRDRGDLRGDTDSSNRPTSFRSGDSPCSGARRRCPARARFRSTKSPAACPCLSLTLDDADLNDPAKGLLPNKLEHGEEWEREGSVSYFEAASCCSHPASACAFTAAAAASPHRARDSGCISGGSTGPAKCRPACCSAQPRNLFAASWCTTTCGGRRKSDWHFVEPAGLRHRAGQSAPSRRRPSRCGSS